MFLATPTGPDTSLTAVLFYYHRYGQLSLVGNATCASAAEGKTLSLTCGANTIEKIVFASYGTPLGSCPDLKTNATCNAPDSLAVVEQMCLHKTSCQILASNAVFGGDPCHLTPKYLTVQLQCSKQQNEPALQFNITAWRVHYPWMPNASSFKRCVVCVLRRCLCVRVCMEGPVVCCRVCLSVQVE